MLSQNFDIVLVGGGLQNGLLALALAERPERVALVESGPRLGGNHVWCFHSADVAEDARAVVEPLIVQRWPAYSVHFRRSSRCVAEPYAATNSERLHELLTGARAPRNLTLFLGERAAHVSAGSVKLESGGEINAKLVIDARGPDGFRSGDRGGYQKFLGLELEVDPGTSPELPTLMDARVEQRDGLRFLYVLPLGEGRVLVEDTYFSDRPALDVDALRAEVLAYAKQQGLAVRRVLREEQGVLPLPARRVRAQQSEPGLIRGGYQGGWFHPTTGYSFPVALRLALAIARSPLAEVHERVQALALERDRQQRYLTFLNRLLFEGFAEDQRINVFERFYGLPTPTIRRFYAMQLTGWDRGRILCGRPPTGFRLTPLLTSQTARHAAPVAPGDTA